MGPNGGEIECFAVNGSNLFAGTSNAGVFLSTDDGATWSSVNAGLSNSDITALAESGDTDLFAGTWGGGVYYSTNNGTSWTAANTGLTNGTVSALAIASNGAGGTNLFAGTSGGGIFLSTNNGVSWTPVDSGLTDTSVAKVRALVVTTGAAGTDSIDVFAGTDNGVFLSTDNGTSWTLIRDGLTTHNVLSLIGSGTIVYAGTEGGGVFFSYNDGTTWTWTEADSGLTNMNVSSLSAINEIVVSDLGAILNVVYLYAGTPTGIFLSTDEGVSWTQVDSGLINTNVLALASSASGRHLFAGTFGSGVFVSSDNGTSWAQASNGLANSDVKSLVAFPSSGGSGPVSLLASTYYGGVSLSTDGGTSWTASNSRTN